MFTITQDGRVLTETIEGVTMPVDYSFAAVNDYVHSPERFYEELEWLSLGMACHIEQLEKQRNELLAWKQQREYFSQIGAAIEDACQLLPAGYKIDLHMEKDAATVRMNLPNQDVIQVAGESVPDAIANAISIAQAHAEKGAESLPHRT
jgi:hypothetical protein